MINLTYKEGLEMVINKKQPLELADIFFEQADSFLKNYRLWPEQKKAFNAIIRCRTIQLGGHINKCSECDYQEQSFNSCRNRHCPKCQFIKKAKWVEKLAGNLPPVKYFHLVFTIPAHLNRLFYLNQRICYSLLFKAAGQALKECAANTNYLGAEIGAVAILHTWGQTLSYHPHIHMIVPAGGMTEDQTEWVPSSKKFLLPAKALSARFRSVWCRLLEKASDKKEIILPDEITRFQTLKNLCYKKKWVVYCEKPFSTPENLIKYLGNYTHRVAISNNRILNYTKEKVTFSFKDYKMAGLRRTISLNSQDFIHRFLLHVLPKGFCKIRYFGFLALRHLKTKLEDCFELIGKTTYLPALEGLNAIEVFEKITGKDPSLCPVCKKGKLVLAGNINPGPE